MEKLRLYFLKGYELDISPLKTLFDDIGLDCEIIEEDFDSSTLPWVQYGKYRYVAPEALDPLAERLWGEYTETIDAVFLFIKEEDWQDGESTLRGWHYAHAPKNYEFALVKEREPRWLITVYHELLHMFDDIIHRELFLTNKGVSLDKMFGFDFDNGVVHGQRAGYSYVDDTEDNKKVITSLVPLLERAVEERRKKKTLRDAFFRILFTFLYGQKRENEPIFDTPEKTGRLEEWASAIQMFEGYGTTRAITITKNFNPGAIRGLDGEFLKFESYAEGKAYLLDYLKRAATGEHKAYKQGMNLLDFYKVYAPSSDNNHPEKYAEFVAHRLNVPISTKIRSLV